MSAPRIAIATNNGDLGGGEVMLLHIAQVLRSLGLDVLVLGPAAPGGLVRAARERGFATEELPARGRRSYMLRLRQWRLQNPRIPLWCNGLVPSFATTGLGPRIVHLHMLPHGPQKVAARAAMLGARRVLVPSRFMAAQLPGTTVLENWTGEIPLRRGAPRDADGPLHVGFLGRLTRDKGVHVLARALELVPEVDGRELRLLLAGENRFGSADDDRAIDAALAPISHRTDRLGWVDRNAFFEAADVVAMPSTAAESFGLVAAEAMASGVPFVISEAGALPEVAGPEHPWCARTGDAEDLARALRAALADAGGAARSRPARARWAERFSPSAGTARVQALLASLDASASTSPTEAP
ncbi:glycosyltransferase family 4 protein [Brachybacterium halotolerans subsp. kimchii]|uniref:glycosyltransferase family 4 protein n=1 Tax=Brachybacterium halotolerans TaxID=2795215 RepID=UPI001E52F7A5|nr:glycosyltransferase family 4 protein [Brachybacterium halotolerans]UEJ81130.1 glycosyltransferase family 4 protein [Brachybacterium halotolerans subsp. kimchii]